MTISIRWIYASVHVETIYFRAAFLNPKRNEGWNTGDLTEIRKVHIGLDPIPTRGPNVVLVALSLAAEYTVRPVYTFQLGVQRPFITCAPGKARSIT